MWSFVIILFYFIVFIFLQQELYQEGHFISSQTRCSNQYHMHSQIQSRTVLCVSNLYFGVWQMGFPPPIFNLKLKMLSLCANWKVFIYMKYGGWKNCDEFWRLTLIKNVRWSVVFVNFAQKIMTIPHFQESIVKSDDTLQSFQTNGVHED